MISFDIPRAVSITGGKAQLHFWCIATALLSSIKSQAG
jgi:hypothetical protein